MCLRRRFASPAYPRCLAMQNEPQEGRSKTPAQNEPATSGWLRCRNPRPHSPSRGPLLLRADKLITGPALCPPPVRAARLSGFLGQADGRLTLLRLVLAAVTCPRCPRRNSEPQQTTCCLPTA